MTDEREIFEKAIELDSDDERQSFLDEACGRNAELRERIEQLLVEHLNTGDFILDQAVEADQEKQAWEFAIGDHIGPYRLMEQIGEGGMGMVYVAEQQEPVKRQVALKIIKPGMDTREVINRFEAERQALAMMDHPNIAKVLDAGSTDNGRPYFVMELVRGIPITRFSDQQKLDSNKRLNLFVDTCKAIQHAHQKGIIHRDIKPGNVLVTMHDDRAVVKVIDFGVAKAIHQPLVDGTVYTKFAQMVGTPLYMSPEQAELNGLNIDTRSDIYSLGVLLYELLTGNTPFDRDRMKQAAFDEMRRIIREEDPPSPSTRVSSLGEAGDSVSQVRGTDQRHLAQQLRGDLDWIVMKSLEKDRRRRYETANGFARDIQRFLDHEPVLASPPSVVYKFRKFARRNRAVIVTATMFATILVLATVISTSMAIKAERARVDAVESARQADVSKNQYEAINDFLINDFLTAARPSGTGPGKDTTVKYALDQAITKIDEAFADQPEIELAIRLPLGVTYRQLGFFDEAERQLTLSLRLHRDLYGNLDKRTLNCRHELARLRHLQSQNNEAAFMFRELANDCLSVYGKSHEKTIYAHRNHAASLLALGQVSEAEVILKEYAEICRQSQEPGSRVLFDTLNELAYMLHDLGRYEDAEPIYRENYETSLEVYGERDTATLVGINNLASVLQDQGKLIEAKPLYEKNLQLRREIFGDKNQRTTVAMNNLAGFMTYIGNYEDGEVLLREALKVGTEVEGPEHRFTLQRSGNLAFNLFHQGRMDEAESLMRKTLADHDRVLGDRHFQTLIFRKRMADILTAQEKYTEADQALKDVLEKSSDDTPWQRLAAAKSSLGYVQCKLDQMTEATALLKECIETYRSNPGKELRQYALALGRLGECHIENGQFEDAEDLLLESYSLTEEQELVPVQIQLASIDRLIGLYEATSNSEQVDQWRTRRLEVEGLHAN